jgi:hypothetical protein
LWRTLTRNDDAGGADDGSFDAATVVDVFLLGVFTEVDEVDDVATPTSFVVVLDDDVDNGGGAADEVMSM